MSEDTIIGDAVEPDRVDAPERAQSIRESVKQAKHDMETVLSSASGRAVLWRLLEKCAVYAPSFHDDPHRTSWREGQRSIGHWLMGEIGVADPTGRLYAMMADEARLRTRKKK